MMFFWNVCLFIVKKTEIDFLIAVKAKRDFKRDVYQENHTSYN